MARQTDYPRASLKNAIQLATAVHELGGSCSVEMAADKLDKKKGGAFTAQYSSAAKYGMVTSSKGQLATTDAFRTYKLAYTPEEEKNCLIDFLLSPPAFHEIYHRFKSIELPVSHFDRLLIREFDVPEQDGSKVAKYFIEGAKLSGLLLPDNKLKDVSEDDSPTIDLNENDVDAVNDTDEESDESSTGPASINLSKSVGGSAGTTDATSEVYSVHIQGPGMNSVINISEEDDIAIVELMLNKIKKKLEATL